MLGLCKVFFLYGVVNPSAGLACIHQQSRGPHQVGRVLASIKRTTSPHFLAPPLWIQFQEAEDAVNNSVLVRLQLHGQGWGVAGVGVMCGWVHKATGWAMGMQ